MAFPITLTVTYQIDARKLLSSKESQEETRKNVLWGNCSRGLFCADHLDFVNAWSEILFAFMLREVRVSFMQCFDRIRPYANVHVYQRCLAHRETLTLREESSVVFCSKLDSNFSVRTHVTSFFQKLSKFCPVSKQEFLYTPNKEMLCWMVEKRCSEIRWHSSMHTEIKVFSVPLCSTHFGTGKPWRHQCLVHSSLGIPSFCALYIRFSTGSHHRHSDQVIPL